jgi:hypothetical protein
MAGEPGAWEEIYAQCHDSLLGSIRRMLGGCIADANLVDEIAAQVWYRLVADDGAMLAQYDPARGGRLVTFLRALAKDTACRYFRAEQRRQAHEIRASRRKLGRDWHDPDEAARSMAEFLATLEPDEKTFCDEYLLDMPADRPGARAPRKSATSLWRWTNRIYRKLLRFLEGA